MSEKVRAYYQLQSEFEVMKRGVDKARTEAVKDLLSERNTIDKQLREYGELEEILKATGSVVIPSQPKAPNNKVGGPRASESSCKICKGLPGHDGRAHRGQDIKAPFTTAELRALNLPTWADSATPEPATTDSTVMRARGRRPGGYNKADLEPRWET